MLTSLVGARSSSIRPTGGMSPLQLQKRISRKNAAKSGMYGRAAGPAIPSAEVAQELVQPLEDVLGPTRDELRAADHEERPHDHDRHHDPHRQDRGADARVEGHEGCRRGRRVVGQRQDDVRSRELQGAVDETDGEVTGLARGAVLRVRRHEHQGEDVEDDHGADEQEPARGQPATRFAGGAAGASATSGVTTCSLDTLAPHTGARLDAALGSSIAGR